MNNLLLYLSDQRRKISGALNAISIPSFQEAHATRLSEASVEEILSLPDAPPNALTPQQLFRFAQIVDTALFKSYLIVKPSLLGSLCRVDNWCEVSEVENELRARGVSCYFCSTRLFLVNMPCRNILSLQTYIEAKRCMRRRSAYSESKFQLSTTYIIAHICVV